MQSILTDLFASIFTKECIAIRFLNIKTQIETRVLVGNTAHTRGRYAPANQSTKRTYTLLQDNIPISQNKTWQGDELQWPAASALLGWSVPALDVGYIADDLLRKNSRQFLKSSDCRVSEVLKRHRFSHNTAHTFPCTSEDDPMNPKPWSDWATVFHSTMNKVNLLGRGETWLEFL